MVLTDRQRRDLHAGIYEYLRAQEDFQSAADAFRDADQESCQKEPTAGKTTLLEKKWTAIPRLQKKVLELERATAHNSKIHSHRTSSGGTAQSSRRMLPRLPAAHTLQGHSAVVLCVKVHPVFTVAVTGSEDGTIKIWDHESGDYVKTLKGHTNNVTGLDFSPTGSYLASSSTDLSIKLWDFSSYACVRTLRGHDHTISAVVFLPLMSAVGNTTANGTTAAASSNNGAAGVDPEAAGSQLLLSASRDKTVKVWDVATGFCEQTLADHHDWVRCMATNGNLIATSGNDTTIVLYDAATRKKIGDLRGHEHVVESVAFLCEPSANVKTVSKELEKARDYLVSGGRDRSVRLWQISTSTCLHVFKFHDNWVRSVKIHPSGNYIISAGDDRSIRILDIQSQRCFRTLESAHSHFVTSLSIHPTLPILMSGSVDNTARCWLLD